MVAEKMSLVTALALSTSSDDSDMLLARIFIYCGGLAKDTVAGGTGSALVASLLASGECGYSTRENGAGSSNRKCSGVGRGTKNKWKNGRQRDRDGRRQDVVKKEQARGEDGERERT